MGVQLKPNLKYRTLQKGVGEFKISHESNAVLNEQNIPEIEMKIRIRLNDLDW